jgi:group I intron endonuclease
MEIGKIYKISNNFDEKLYIGQTWTTLEKRFKNHCKADSKCLKLRNSIQAHGKENFTIELLWEGECTQQELDDYEIELIDLFKTTSPFGYNLKEGGSGGRHSEESKEKMSAASTNPSAETRLKRSLALTGRIVSEETRRRLSESHKGYKPTDETRQKLSIAAKGRTLTQEHREKLSKAKKGVPLSADQKIKLNELHEKNKGRVVSEETRVKMRAAQQERRVKEKERCETI